MNNATQTATLQEQVRMVGDLLGEVLCELGGEALYNDVERLRKGYLKLSASNNDKERSELMKYIESLDIDRVEEVIRSFNIFYMLSNIVEENLLHRNRRKLYKTGSDSLWKGSFLGAVKDMKEQGLSADELQK